MSWKVEFRPEVEDDVAEAAAWYEAREAALGRDFLTEVIRVLDRLAGDPLTGARGGSSSEVRWLSPTDSLTRSSMRWIRLSGRYW